MILFLSSKFLILIGDNNLLINSFQSFKINAGNFPIFEDGIGSALIGSKDPFNLLNVVDIVACKHPDNSFDRFFASFGVDAV